MFSIRAAFSILIESGYSDYCSMLWVLNNNKDGYCNGDDLPPIKSLD